MNKLYTDVHDALLYVEEHKDELPPAPYKNIIDSNKKSSPNVFAIMKQKLKLLLPCFIVQKRNNENSNITYILN